MKLFNKDPAPVWRRLTLKESYAMKNIIITAREST